MSATDVGVLATLVLFALPVLIGAVTFSVLIAGEITQLLETDRIKKALEFRLNDRSASWSLSENVIPWPAIQLEWSVVTSMIVILAGVEFVARDPQFKYIWFIAGSASSVLAFGTPLYLYLFCHRWVLRIVKSEILSRLNTLTREEDIFLRRLNLTGARINKLYSEVNLQTSIQAAEIGKNILYRRATERIRNARSKLDQAIETLHKFSEQVGEHLELYRQVTRDFDFTKNMIIDRGSVTLLDELDRINAVLKSKEISQLFDGAQWEKLQIMLGQLAFDLSLLRNMAEGGSDLPLSLGQACDLLNITRTTSIKSAKAVVDALRKAWHPDTGFGDEDKGRRTIKTAQINVAWDIFCAAYEDAGGETKKKIKRTMALAN